MISVTVRVPATTANLACGFDTLGCALSLYNTLSFTLSDRLSFTGCDEEFQTPDNLACQGFDAVYARLGRPAPAVHIDIRADIPVCRGLGSSAAMLAAGAMAANALSGAKLSKAELLSIITPIEGHPDNLAPALFGGLVASTSRDGKVYSAVNAKGCEHMVKEAYACVYTYLALAVKLHEHLYISFLSFSFYLRCTHFHHLYRLKSYLYCICMSRQTLFFCNKNYIVLCFSESVLSIVCKA